MITNFEEYTDVLTKEEKKMIPVLIRCLTRYDSTNPILSDDLIRKVNYEGDISLTGPRLRKLCNFIRSYGILPLIATSKGYYVSYSRVEIEKQIKSLEERAQAIQSSADGLRMFLDKYKGQMSLIF